MTTATLNETQRAELIDKGYTIFKDVLPLPVLQEIRALSEELADQLSPADKEKYKYQGSSIPFDFAHSLFARLSAWPAALEALDSLGYPETKFLSGYILSKPPQGPALYWHQDWTYWNDPISLSENPPQLFLMYYLTDTTPHNGCLKVIPGSHRRRIDLHDSLPEAHTTATFNAANNPDSPLFAAHPDEVNIEVKAGDLVIGDARVLHAAYANNSEHRRTCLTLWYLPTYDALPDSIKANIRRMQEVGFMPRTVEDMQLMERLLPTYRGMAQPQDWNRDPRSTLA